MRGSCSISCWWWCSLILRGNGGSSCCWDGVSATHTPFLTNAHVPLINEQNSNLKSLEYFTYAYGRCTCVRMESMDRWTAEPLPSQGGGEGDGIRLCLP